MEKFNRGKRQAVTRSLVYGRLRLQAAAISSSRQSEDSRMSRKVGPGAASAFRQRLEKTAETASLIGVSTISARR